MKVRLKSKAPGCATVIVDCTRLLNNWPCVRVYYLRPVHESLPFACFSFSFPKAEKTEQTHLFGGKEKQEIFQTVMNNGELVHFGTSRP